MERKRQRKQRHREKHRKRQAESTRMVEIERKKDNMEAKSRKI